MNKQELLAILATKYYKVKGTLNESSEFGDVKYYTARVIEELPSGAFNDTTVAFWVEKEGTAQEKAVWQRAEPKPDVSPILPFSVRLNAFLASKMADGTIDAAFVENTDDANERAIVKAVINLGEKRVLIDKDAQGKFRYRLLA